MSAARDAMAKMSGRAPVAVRADMRRGLALGIEPEFR